MKSSFRRIRFAIFVFLIIAIFASLVSCDKNSNSNIAPKNRVFYEYFDTVSVIYDYSGSENEEFSKLCSDIEDKLSYYHKLFDIYNEYEGIINLATLNNTAGEGAKKVSPEICELLSFAKDMYGKTDGKVNFAMGAVLSLWHEAREAAKPKEGYTPIYYVPEYSDLAAAGGHINPENVIIDTENSTVEIIDPQLRLDVGAVAKGFVAEKISDFIKSKGLSGYAIDLGGNIRAVGTKPDGSGWESGVRAPGDEYANVKKITDSSRGTSGVYERTYTVNGKNYHHIIDPETLMPENHYWSVSIHTENSAVADALSTAFFNMTNAEIITYLHNFPNTEVTLIYPDGSVQIIGETG